MRSTPAFLFVSGFVSGAAAILLAHGRGEPPLPEPPAFAQRPGSGQRPEEPASAVPDTAVLQTILHQLTALHQRLDGQRDREPAAAPVAIDEDALLAAFVRVREREERQRLDAMNDRELFDAASQLLNAGQTDRPRCKRMLMALLERPLQPGMRATARRQLACVHRDSDEFDAAKRLLQRSRDEFGDDSVDGAAAAIELAQILVRAGDAPGGVALADTVARVAPHGQRGHARWTAAWAARCAGDLARARADFASLAREYADDPHEKWVADASRRQLAELDHTNR